MRIIRILIHSQNMVLSSIQVKHPGNCRHPCAWLATARRLANPAWGT